MILSFIWNVFCAQTYTSQEPRTFALRSMCYFVGWTGREREREKRKRIRVCGGNDDDDSSGNDGDGSDNNSGHTNSRHVDIRRVFSCSRSRSHSCKPHEQFDRIFRVTAHLFWAQRMLTLFQCLFSTIFLRWTSDAMRSFIIQAVVSFFFCFVFIYIFIYFR